MPSDPCLNTFNRRSIHRMRGDLPGLLRAIRIRAKGVISAMNNLYDAPTIEEIKETADNYWLSWLARGDWLRSKVNQLEYLDKTTVECTLTYDVDMAKLNEFIVPDSVGDRGVRQLLPLDVMDDAFYMPSSIDSPWGKHACLATQQETARFATLMLFGIINDRYPLRQTFDNIENEVVKEVYDAFLGSVHSSDFDESMCAAIGYTDKEEVNQLKVFISWLRNSTFLLLNVPANDGERGMVEFSFNVRRKESGKKLVDRLGVTSSSILIPSAESNDDADLGTHLRFMVPAGMRVDDVEYENSEGDAISDSSEIFDLIDATAHCNGRAVSISVLPSSVRAPKFNIRIRMNPKRGIFTIPAFVACLVSYIVGQLVAYWVSLIPPHPDKDAVPVFPAQAITPIAALIPAFIASYVLVAREHEELSFALGFRRLLLSVGAVSSVVFSVVLALGMADGDAGRHVRFTLTLYPIIQGGLLLFFLYDIVRIELWRRVAAHSKGKIVVMSMLFIALWFTLIERNLTLWG